jgi:23S rRNA (adenine2503-C2)-methyltransferase
LSRLPAFDTFLVMNTAKIQQVLAAAGINKPYRLKQAVRAAYRDLVPSWEAAAELPPELRTLLDREAPIMSLTLEREAVSADGRTVKAALRTTDGKTIETVLMAHEDGRRTVCVSSQAGCAMRCAFCATGAGGFSRNLTAEEISDQVLHFARRHVVRERRDAASAVDKKTVTNVVVMGMGEPMNNYDAVLAAIRELNRADGLGIGIRHFTVSTCGVVPGIERFATEPEPLNLAVSLHAPNQALRERIMPVAAAYPLDQLLAACRAYVEQTGRKIFFEYLLLDGVNDGDEQADELARIMDHELYHVNLIKYHATGAFRASPPERCRAFQRRLWDQHRVPVTFRVDFGEDISAACGQLAGQKPKDQPRGAAV